MVFAITFLIGVTSCAVRSWLCYAFSGVAIAMVFVAACVAAPEPMSIHMLALALLGFNGGIFICVVGMLAASSVLHRA